MAKESPRKNEATWVESRQRWQIKVQKDGERKTFTSSITGKKGKFDAERKADKWLTEGESKDIRFQKLWDNFLAETKLLTSTANYAKHEQIGRTWILPGMKNKKTSSLTRQDYQECINRAYKAGRAKKTLKHIRGSLTCVHAFAEADNVPMVRPIGLKIPKDAKVGHRTILQPTDLKLLFKEDSITHYNRSEPCFFICAWRFIVLTGLRRGELCGLRKEDIVDGVMHIQRSVTVDGEITPGKTANARRHIVLTDRMLQTLDAQDRMLKAAGIISPWVFPDESGEMLQSHHLYRKWLTYRKQHGLKSTLHELRHTMISVVKADVPEDLLKPVVGHSKNMDTGHYKQAVSGDDIRAAKLIEQAFDRVLS